MLWETEEACAPILPGAENIVDLVFQIECRQLPLDHAYALSQALCARLPWFAEEGGLHLLHGAASGNGWERPQGEDAMIHLSRRTRLILRLAQSRVDETSAALCGETLTIDGHALQISTASVKPLSKTTVLFARHVLMSFTPQTEEAFEHAVLAQLGQAGLHCRKILCGRSSILNIPPQKWHTRSLMLADLSLEDALQLQQKGLGEGRALGCGLFVPHKDIKSVTPQEQAEG
jgi:CRISPR-associated protein Cas6